MRFPRSSGIVLHPTSLPGNHGIGDLGNAAYRFVDWLAAAGQKLWQVLPLGSTGYGDSPYQLFSAFAGNPLLIDLDALADEGFLDPAALAAAPAFTEDEVDFGAVLAWKLPLLREASALFLASPREDYEQFCLRNAAWLDDFALFMALKEEHGGVAWNCWAPAFVRRDLGALEQARTRLRDNIDVHKFAQYAFFRQWIRLKDYARERGIRIMGDLPIYVAHDSADVWANPELFLLDENGSCTFVAGVPPDYFSATGQLWGNPIYRWDALKERGYGWWIERFRATLALVDMVRLDHFRGFEAYWQVPGGETTAINGEWVKGPGAAFFAAIESAMGKLPLVAENLGVITPEVEELLERFEYPGMAILQFAFGTDPQALDFRPHNYPRNRVAYSGTHDNETTVGWWTTAGAGNTTRTAEDVARERTFARKYLNTTGHEINWVFIRTLIASVADTVLFPVQDVLGLGNEARMNLPGTFGGNWRWRMRSGALRPEHAARLRDCCVTYDR
ncbi:MAG TPA: 4-alpha-glucanotransferase [Bryobacteraceae bacterium]|nr:4-alpha-glucanotransferase [Bryobacteraceae bacterium]